MPGILMQTCFFFLQILRTLCILHIKRATIFAYLPWKTYYRHIGAKLWTEFKIFWNKVKDIDKNQTMLHAKEA